MCFNKGGYSVDVPMRRFALKSEEKMLLRDRSELRSSEDIECRSAIPGRA
jgi:hypothetical protein